MNTRPLRTLIKSSFQTPDPVRGVAPMKHREEEKLSKAVKTCLEAENDAVEQLQNPIIKEEIRKLRSMANE